MTSGEREPPRPSARVRILSPLREREFALLWTGMTVSLLGDGIYFVAIAWQAYALSNAPTALSLVGVAWTLPTVILLLLGGAISDHYERRRVLLVASIAEAAAIGLIGILSVTGSLQLWMLLALVAAYGSGEAFFNPAFDAIVPTLVPPQELASASALGQFVRPLSVQLIGPAIGGVLVALLNPGTAFLVDAGTFLVAVWTLLMMRRVPRVVGPARTVREAFADVAVGFRFVRANPWLWGTLAAACLSLLAFFGPSQVLLPFLVKNVLHAGGGGYGLVRAASGVGAILVAPALAQRGTPRRCMTVMFCAWSAESLALIAFGIATRLWVFVVISLATGGLAVVGNVIWGTLMNRLVPGELRGRVSSFDWTVSIGLIPVSFAVTGPIAAAIGVRATLIGAGALGSVAMIAFLAVPGLRDPETRLLSVEVLPELADERDRSVQL